MLPQARVLIPPVVEWSILTKHSDRCNNVRENEKHQLAFVQLRTLCKPNLETDYPGYISVSLSLASRNAAARPRVTWKDAAE